TDFAISRPIVVTLCMLPSSESWSPQRRPPQWHLRAGGGAVHSIRSGIGLGGGAWARITPATRPSEEAPPAFRNPHLERTASRCLVLCRCAGRAAGEGNPPPRFGPRRLYPR